MNVSFYHEEYEAHEEWIEHACLRNTLPGIAFAGFVSFVVAIQVRMLAQFPLYRRSSPLPFVRLFQIKVDRAP